MEALASSNILTLSRLAVAIHADFCLAELYRCQTFCVTVNEKTTLCYRNML